MVLSIVIKYPSQTKERNKVFFEKKDQELMNLDWSQQGGWFDTDGCFSSQIYKPKVGKLYLRRRADLKLKDRQPVELFSKTFETSLICTKWKSTTPEPYKKEYLISIYQAELTGEKAVWFAKNVYPYLIKQEKKDYAAKLLGYRPESKNFSDWTPEEVRNYLATALEGDGSFVIRLGKRTTWIRAKIASSEVQYLSDIKYIAEKKLGTIFTLAEVATYKTQKGIKTKYALYIDGSQNRKNLDFFQSLVKDGVMTLDRKKQKVQQYLNDLE